MIETERLYNLLPALYRVQDATNGEPLRALLALIEREYALLEVDLERLYDNWFIETCDEWAVPYIGDLLGVRGVVPPREAASGPNGQGRGPFSQRGRVSNAIAYRRRKGTAAMLEQLARDVTGYSALAVEFFELLAATQYLNHPRPGKGGTASLRDSNALELVGGPFDPLAHSVDVRHIDSGRGWYNIPNIGLFLWRIASYSVARATPRPLAEAGRYSFSPLGIAMPLWSLPRSETTHQPAAEHNVSLPLRRRALRDELDAARRALAQGEQPRFNYFGSDPVLEVWVREAGETQFTQIRPQNIQICNLDADRRPQAPFAVAADPRLGRLAFPVGLVPERVLVSYAYGFCGDLGGGPYDRRESVGSWLDERDVRPTWQLGVARDAEDDPAGERFDPRLRGTLAAAVAAWNEQPAGTLGIIAIMDSGSYAANLSGAATINIPAGSSLAIVAAGWPEEADPDNPPFTTRIPRRLVPANLRPHLLGSLAVRGTAPADSLTPGELILDGLLVEGALNVLVGNLGALRLLHSTIVPPNGLTVNVSTQPGQQNERLQVRLVRSICGPIALPDTVARLALSDTIVDGAAGAALAGPDTTIERSTIVGTAALRTLDASEAIFSGRVDVARRQIGCVRYSYVPLGSLAPRRYRCRPAGALEAQRVTPRWASLRYGDPDYGLLASGCPAEIAEGAENGGEMGAFNFLQQAQRVRALRDALDEFLRFGLEAGITVNDE